MSIIGSGLDILFPEVPGMYQEIQYIHMDNPTAAGSACFALGVDMSEFSGFFKATTAFYLDSYSSLPGNYGFIFSYGRQNDNVSGLEVTKTGVWEMRRARRVTIAGSSATTGAALDIELYDTAGTQYVKSNSTTVVTGTEASAFVAPGEVYVGGHVNYAGYANLPGAYGRFTFSDANGVMAKAIPVKRKSDSAIGYLTINRYGYKQFHAVTVKGTISGTYITAGPDVT